MCRGWLYAGRGPIFWSKKRHKLTIFMGEDEVRLQGMFGTSLQAWLCVDCQLVLLPYGKQKT